MYILTDIATATQNDKLRAAAQTQPTGQAYAVRRSGNRGGPARRLVGRRIRRARRTVQAY